MAKVPAPPPAGSGVWVRPFEGFGNCQVVTMRELESQDFPGKKIPPSTIQLSVHHQNPQDSFYRDEIFSSFFRVRRCAFFFGALRFLPCLIGLLKPQRTSDIQGFPQVPVWGMMKLPTSFFCESENASE